MKRNKGRTAVTFTGIALMVMLMTCVFVGKDTVLRYLEKVASLHSGSWHMTVYGLDNANCKEVAAVDGIDKIGYVARKGFTEFPASANKDRPYLEIKAYSPICFELTNIHVTQGRLPENEKEIIISKTQFNKKTHPILHYNANKMYLCRPNQMTIIHLKIYYYDY